ARVFLEQLALAGGELAGNLDVHAYELVAAAVALQIGNAFPLEAENHAGLRARRNLDLGLVLQRRHLDLGAERELGERDGQLADDVLTLASEQRVLGHRDDHVEIALGPAGKPRLALTAELEPRAAVDAGGDLHAQILRDADAPGAAARGAGIGDDRAFAAALAAGLGDREEALLETDLAAAPA